MCHLTHKLGETTQRQKHIIFSIKVKNHTKTYNTNYFLFSTLKGSFIAD